MLWIARRGVCRRIDLLEGVIEFFVVDRDKRFGVGDRVARVESGVPLAIFGSESDDHDIRFLDEGLVPDPVDPRPFVILPERGFFFAENLDPAMVARVMIGYRGGRPDLQVAFRRPRGRTAPTHGITCGTGNDHRCSSSTDHH